LIHLPPFRLSLSRPPQRFDRLSARQNGKVQSAARAHGTGVPTEFVTFVMIYRAIQNRLADSDSERVLRHRPRGIVQARAWSLGKV